MVVRMSAVWAGRPTFTPQEDSWNLFLLEAVDPRSIVWLEGLGQLKNPMTSSGIEPIIFWLVAECLNQLRYRMPHLLEVFIFI
jgi:hypothetical protein